MRTYTGMVTKLEPNQRIVVGINTQGRHGKGAALWAKNNAGAIYGCTDPVQGSSYCLVTKDLTKKVHPSIGKGAIISQIIHLYDYAQSRDHLDFMVAYSYSRTNLNGYTSDEMAEMFAVAGKYTGIPDNIIFESQFSKLVIIYLDKYKDTETNKTN